MNSTIEALSAVFGVFSPQQDRFCVPLRARNSLIQLGARIAGKQEKLVGLYVPESAEPEYNSDSAQYGRVVALVRMKGLAQGLPNLTNYPSGCMELRGPRLVDRWPIGWPSDIVFLSPHGGPVLRDAVLVALHRSDFAGFTVQFQHGPIDLRLLPTLRSQLMAQVRHDIARNPNSQIQQF
jgi:hypothetical protein